MFQKLKKAGSTALAFLVAAGMFPAGSMITSAADTADSDAVFYVTEAACSHSEDKTILKSYTKEELQELAEENTEPAAYMYFKSGINVVGVTEYVTFEQLLADIDWEKHKEDGETFAYVGSDGFSYAAGYDILDSATKDDYCFFPQLTADESSVDDAYPVPACVALKWGLESAESGNEMTAGALADKIFKSASLESLRACIGSLETDVASSSGTTAGNRLVDNVCELSFVSPSELEHHDAVEATKTGPGNIEYWECSVCHKKFSDAKAKNPVSDEDIIIPTDTVALTITEADCVHADKYTKLKEYFMSELRELAASNEESLGYLHIKDDFVTVYGVTEYVTYEQVLADINWEAYKDAGRLFSLIASADGFASTQSWDLLDSVNKENYKFYPNITATGRNVDDAYVVPAVISLKCGSEDMESGSEITASEALESACKNAKNSIRAFSGSLEKDALVGGNTGTVAGNRLVTNVDTVSFVKPYSLEKHEAHAATTEAAGNIEYYECSACGKKFKSAKGTGELTDEEVIIPKLEQQPSGSGTPQQKADLNTATVTVTNASKQVYTGKALTPAVTVTVNGKTVPASEYTVDYKNNTNAGNATVTVAAKPTSTSYTGKKEVTFKIAKAAQTIKLASESKTLKVKKLKNNKVTKKETFTFTVKNAKTKLNVTCKDKKVTAKVSGKKVTVTVKKGAKKGNYTLKVNAKETANYKASAVKKFKLKVKKAA